MAEMTGTMPPKEREKRWADRRVFFVTPQILANDIKRGACKASDIVCIVVDEAHRAQGKHSYCNVIREISGATRYFRYNYLRCYGNNQSTCTKCNAWF